MFPFLNFLYVFYEIFIKNRSIFFFFFCFQLQIKKKIMMILEMRCFCKAGLSIDDDKYRLSAHYR